MSKEKLTLNEVVNIIDANYCKYYSRGGDCDELFYDRIESIIKEYSRQCCEESLSAIRKQWYIPNNPKNLKMYFPQEITK